MSSKFTSIYQKSMYINNNRLQHEYEKTLICITKNDLCKKQLITKII